MRIAYVSADHGIPVFGNKGASIHIQELVNTFCALGHEVHLIASQIGGPSVPIAAEVFKVRTGPIPVASDVQSQAGDSSRLNKENRYIEIGRDVEAEILARHEVTPFDLIYERYSLWSAAGTRAARRIGVPCIVEVNAPLLAEQRQYRKLVLEDSAKAIEREVFANADAIMAVSREIADYVISNGARAESVHVQPNGVNLNLFNPNVVPLPITGAKGNLVIGFVGSLKPWHGIEDLLEAFVEVRKAHERCWLLIVGDGPKRGWIEGFVRGAGLDNDTILTDWVPYREMPSVIKRMDVAVTPYPKIDNFYYSPLKLFEYLAVGRPVVASGIGQIKDIVDDGRTGLLSRPGDPKHLAECILKLLEDKALRDRLGAAGAEVGRGFSWNVNAQKVIDLAQELASSPPKSESKR